MSIGQLYHRRVRNRNMGGASQSKRLPRPDKSGLAVTEVKVFTMHLYVIARLTLGSRSNLGGAVEDGN